MKPTAKQLLTLVGNPDVYAVQHKDGSWHPVREPITLPVLRDHRDGKMTVGTYIVNPPDQARTLVFDIDDPSGAVQREMVEQITTILADNGLAYGVEWSGKKGYHVWVLVDQFVDAAMLYRIGRGVREEAGYPALEVFPKQTEVRDLGNLVKLPGGFHAVTGNANDFLDEDSHPQAGTGFPGVNLAVFMETVAARYPEVQLRKRRDDAPATVEFPCVWTIQNGVTEGGRNTQLFHLATMLRRWSLTDENVERIVRKANEDSTPPLDEAELAGILDNSSYSGPVCGQLPDDVHCGDQCIMARHSGLYTRVGALKWAPDGDVVTIEVASRTEDGTTLELKHPDMVQGRAILSEAPRKDKT